MATGKDPWDGLTIREDGTWDIEADLEPAEPYTPPACAPPVKLKVSGGNVTPAHPGARLARTGPVRIVMINEIPAGTPMAEVIRRYSQTVDPFERAVPIYHWPELGAGRILRELTGVAEMYR